MMIGTRLRAARIARTASMPFISGISMSMVTRSGLSCSSFATATLPFTAVPTTSMSGSADSTSVTILRTTTESSTTITLIGFTRVLLLPCWVQPSRLSVLYRQESATLERGRASHTAGRREPLDGNCLSEK